MVSLTTLPRRAVLHYAFAMHRKIICALFGVLCVVSPTHAAPAVPLVAPIPWKNLAPPAPVKPLPPKTEAALKTACADYFATLERKEKTFAPALEKLLRQNPAAVRRLAWEAYKATPLHAVRKADFDDRQVRFDKHLSPYTVKTVGKRPADGWPLFIALHGGGGAPKAVNDSQWQIMQIYYKDHPELGGYQYVALRAPNDTWNGFYDDYVYPLVENLIRQFLLFGDVNADKVFLMGYSHGGYGAFAIGPKMPDRFAAVHASASAPTDGETSAKTLRSLVFSAMIGENDTMYGRIERNKKFAETIKQLRGERTDIYPVTVEMISGAGHPGLPDRDKIVDLYSHTRNPLPREISWEQTDGVIHDFYWLHCDEPAKKKEISATCADNSLSIKTTPDVKSITVRLDERLIDFKKPVTLDLNGEKSTLRPVPSLRVLCESLLQRGDPGLAFTALITVP
jgi:predicted esterase